MMNDEGKSSLSVLHDCLALGQIEVGLPASFQSSTAEIHRLPVLMRWLSSSDHNGQVPAAADYENYEEDEEERADEIIEEAVARLEDRAAFYSVAEEVEMIACHLAPSVTKRVSKIPPLKRQWKNGKPRFNVSELEALAQDPVGNLHNKRRRAATEMHDPSAASKINNNDHSDDDNDDDVLRPDFIDDDNDDEILSEKKEFPEQLHQSRKRNRSDGGEDRLTSAMISEDSPEFIATKTLQELILLTAKSLKPETPFAIRGMEDSTLAAEAEATGHTKGAASNNADLAARVVSLMHYTPVLRHDHVAGALCRAAVPQAPALIARMGANCPAAIPCLVRGCIDVYREATVNQRNCSVANVASKAIRRLAGLSKREADRILTMLKVTNNCLMIDVQLELAMQQNDILAVACLLLEHLPHQQTSHDTLMDDENDRRQTTYNAANITSPTVIHTSLQKILENSTEMLSNTIDFLLRHLRNLKNRSKMCFILSAYSMIFFRVSMDGFSITEVGKACLSHGLDILCDQAKDFEIGEPKELKIVDRENSDLPDRHPLDRLFSHLFCCFILTVTTLLEAEDVQQEMKAKCAEVLNDWFSMRINSRCMEALRVRIFMAIKNRDSASLCNVLQEYIYDETSYTTNPRKSFDNEAISLNLSRFCDWACSVLRRETSVEKKRFIDSSVIDPSVAIDYLKLEADGSADSENLIREFFRQILFNKSAAYTFCQSSAAFFAISKMTAKLMEVCPSVPLVSSIQLEQVSKAVDEKNKCNLSDDFALLLTQITHCMAFFGIDPNSPFNIDPRSLPLQKIYLQCERFKENGLSSLMKTCAKALVDCICPDVERRMRRYLFLETAIPRDSWYPSTKEKSKSSLFRILRKSVANASHDPSGIIAARTFSAASCGLELANLFTISASALLSRPGSSPIFFTFSMLYKDPLLLLKCPLSIWARRGLRRIVLFMLSYVLEINDFVAGQTGPPIEQDAVTEFVDCRNEIIMRSLVTIASSPEKADNSFVQCSATTGLIRKLITRYPGLTAGLLKHGLNELQTDWLVESVPESIEDVEDLERLLIGRNYLTAAEKLMLADSVLRIAIMHGHLIGSKTQKLVCATMSQMIASFFLIIGPSGVAVNTLLVGEGEGLDASQVSRKAAFRMLRALQKVRGFQPQLRNECTSSLQKFAGMIKGEVVVATLPSAIANRQKTLLTDLLDAVVKALDAMGNGTAL